MAMVAISGKNIIVFAQRGYCAYANRFLPDIQMTEPSDFAFAVFLRGAFFKPADEKHLAVQVDEFCIGQS